MVSLDNICSDPHNTVLPSIHLRFMFRDTEQAAAGQSRRTSLKVDLVRGGVVNSVVLVVWCMGVVLNQKCAVKYSASKFFTLFMERIWCYVSREPS